MCIQTSRDAESTWTQQQPTHLMIQRIATFARSSVALLLKLITTSTALTSAPAPPDAHWKSLFKTPFQDYDILIVLHSHALPRCALLTMTYHTYRSSRGCAMRRGASS